MFRSILVPLDGSPLSERALPLAVGIARNTHAALHLVHVHSISSALMYSPDLAYVDASLDETMIEQEKSYLDSIANQLREQFDMYVDAKVLNGMISDSVADMLTHQALSCAADMVVMTTHGRGGLARFWLGSVADELVRRLPMPLLLLRPDQHAPDSVESLAPRHILIPLDGSKSAESVLQYARALGEAIHADFTLLRVIEPVMSSRPIPTDPAVREMDDQLIDQLRIDCQIYLEQIAQQFADRSLQVQTKVVVADHAVNAILEEAHHESVDLIAMATHGRSGLSRLLVGSVADKLIRGITKPVLLYRLQARKEHV